MPESYGWGWAPIPIARAIHTLLEIANHISEQSGAKSDPNNIFISNGASEVARMVLFATFADSTMASWCRFLSTPCTRPHRFIWRYPIPYYLDEDNEWVQISLTYRKALMRPGPGAHVCALWFSSTPETPLDNVSLRRLWADLIQFAFDNELVLCADEVYQENLYNMGETFLQRPHGSQ